MNYNELYWLTGIIEGEGCIDANHNKNPRIRVSMTDEDIIRRVQKIALIGNVIGPYDKGKNCKPIWTWVTYGLDAELLIIKILPLFSNRRKMQAIEVLYKYNHGFPNFYNNNNNKEEEILKLDWIKNLDITYNDQFCWLIGLIEGEGCIDTNSNNILRIRITMTDEDTVRKVYKIAMVGNINGPYQDKRGNRKYSWTWDANGLDAELLITKIFPILGDRRKLQASKALYEYRHRLCKLG